MKARLTPDAVKATGDQLRALGAFQRIELLERSEEAGNRRYQYRIVFERDAVLCTVVLTKDDKVSSVRLQPE
jgi:hypothetical protein